MWLIDYIALWVVQRCQVLKKKKNLCNKKGDITGEAT